MFIFQKRSKIFGEISEEGYWDNPIEVEAIQKLKQKRSNVVDLRKLLGFIGYYRASIRDFSRKQNLSMIY